MRILIKNSQRKLKLKTRNLKWLAAKILRMQAFHNVELSLLFVSNHQMKRLNRTYRNRDKVTDVLAFPLQEGWKTSAKKRGFPPYALTPIGDVVICIPQAVRQAHRYHHSIDEEILFLLVHGILHLLGYDHETSLRRAWAMKRKEQAILQRFSQPVPSLRYGGS